LDSGFAVERRRLCRIIDVTLKHMNPPMEVTEVSTKHGERFTTGAVFLHVLADFDTYTPYPRLTEINRL
jgi:hypothetical protein